MACSCHLYISSLLGFSRKLSWKSLPQLLFSLILSLGRWCRRKVQGKNRCFLELYSFCNFSCKSQSFSFPCSTWQREGYKLGSAPQASISNSSLVILPSHREQKALCQNLLSFTLAYIWRQSQQSQYSFMTVKIMWDQSLISCFWLSCKELRGIQTHFSLGTCLVFLHIHANHTDFLIMFSDSDHPCSGAMLHHIDCISAKTWAFHEIMESCRICS